MNKSELFSYVCCALTHNINACDTCKLCGSDGIDARMKLVEELANYMDETLPWKRKKSTKKTE